jgi:hypothetical protein
MIRRIFLFMLMLCLTAPAPVRGHSVTVTLDGVWRICQDPDNVGRTESWFQNTLTQTSEIAVPGTLQTVFREYHGVVWYERTFITPENPNADGRMLLRFWQAEYRADVWLNGVPLGAHEGGEEMFELDATDALRPVGETNRLTVRVLNAADEPIDGISLANIPSCNNTNTIVPGSGYASGGLVDSVELVCAPAIRIVDLHLIPDWQTGRIDVRATVDNTTNQFFNASLTLYATSLDGGEATPWTSNDVSIAPGNSIIASALVVPDFKLWDLNDPNLYSVTARLDDSAGACFELRSATCGFRDFRFENGYFRLNGKRIYVKCSHSGSDSPITHRIPLDPDLYRKDILISKTMGFNMIRYIAGMPRRFQLDLCDRIGFMVYDECLAGWHYADCPERPVRWDEQTSAMIRRDRNHPSVVAWGLLNETYESPFILQAANYLPKARELDPTRLIFLNSGSFDALSSEEICVADYATWRKGAYAIMPAAVKNEKSEDLEFSGALWPAGVFALHPGDVDHEFSALKWTAPKAGDYALQASFKDIAKDGAATVDLRLVKETADGSVRALWQGGLNLNGYGKEIEVEKIDPALLSFEQGESLYAIVGVGDGSGYGDSVAVQMTLTASDGVEYDASRDFSWERNPNGVWSYGWLPADSEPQIDSFTLFDVGQPQLLAGPIGRISNPGSLEWENILADTHPYKKVPHTAAIINELRTHSQDSLPVFLSEYGIGSAVSLWRLMRLFEQYDGTDAADAKHYRWRYDNFDADWKRWSLDDTFANQEDFFRQAISLMAEQRRIGINAIRANANVISHSVTGTNDQGISGEGLTTLFRELKPGAVDAMADVFAPLRFCNFVEPVQVYAGQKVRVESVLVNEDVLKPGVYPVRLVAFGPNNERLFDKTTTITIAEPAEGEETPMVMPALNEEFVVDADCSDGECKFYAELLSGGATSGGVERFYVFDRRKFPSVGDGRIFVWGDDPDLLGKLQQLDIPAAPFTQPDGSAVELQPGDRLIVGRESNRRGDAEFQRLYDAVRSGVGVLFLSSNVFANETDATHWLPFDNKGVFNVMPDWLYHKDDWARRDSAFDGLECGGVLDYVFYRDLIPVVTFKLQEPEPDVAIAGAFSTQMGYDSGLSMAEWKLGQGKILLSTWLIQESLPSPIAERMLINLLNKIKTN